MNYQRKGLFLLLAFIFCSYCFLGCKNETEQNQEEPLLFKGKSKSTSQLPLSIYLGKDSIGSYKFPYEVDTMKTRQWAFVKEKGAMLAILEDSINLNTDEGLDRLENIIGYQEIDFNPKMLNNHDSFSAELFGDTIKFNVDSSEILDINNELWSGQIQDKNNSSFIIYQTDSIFSASFYFNETKYELRSENENYFIERIDQERFYDEEEPLYEFDFDNEDDVLEDEIIMKDTNEFIDVLVCYTKTASDQSGGKLNIYNHINRAVIETNLSYKNSKVSTRLRLVDTMKLNYKETGISKNDVTWIQQNKKVRDRRNKVKADLVVFMVENLNGSCGRAYAIQKSLSTKFAPYAYCVVKKSCATGYYSFGHEVGHLMGGRHDCKNDSNLTPFEFNHGFEYCKITNSWRTIMSYSNCRSKRLPYWSNPNVKYNGVSMGEINGNTSCKSNNSELLNKASLTVANFRIRQSPIK
ncbi:M12 family metallo-peptidase [Flavivirga algicola]|uniref:Peptidase M12B domain-containing protein n=1 Tax=Flavivirga algicola TaxID=2729136 RepID=A0ABX1S0J8_9FLAO|nr:M12 family metallo-peptidase [Flavivirga algicola]NMH88254.1 hypothetical protein [Flavivirga algicola]